MFKLKFRSTPMIALGVLIALGAAAGGYFILKQMPDKVIELHIAAVIAAAIFLPAIITLIAYQMTTAAQKVQVSALMTGLILMLAGVDNFLVPQMRMLADGVLLFNYIAFAITLLGGIASTFLLLTGAQDSVYGDLAPGQKEDPADRKRREQEAKEADKAMNQAGSGALRGTTSRAPVVAPESALAKAADETPAAKTSAEQPAPSKFEEERKAGSTSATNLKGILDTLAPEEETTETAKPTSAELDAIRPSSAELDAIKPSTSALDAIKTPGTDAKPEAKSPLRSMLKKPDSPASQLIRPGAKADATPTPTPAPAAAAEPAATVEEKSPVTPAPAPENVNASPSSTMRLQAQKRKGTSTFTKLQALSASGGVRADKPQGGEGGELKSILDRLDNTADTTEEAPMDSLFGGGRLVTSRTDIPAISEDSAELNTASTSASAPASPPSQLKRPGLGVTLGGNKPKPEIPSTPAASAVTPAEVTPAAAPATDSTTSGESIADQLNSIQTPGSGGNKSASGGLGSSGLGAKSGASNKIGIGSHASTSATDLTPLPEKAPEAEVQAEVAKAPEVTVPASEEEEDESNSIFAKGVDKEIDDIFDNLVSEEAQKEVKDVDISTLTEASAATTPESVSTTNPTQEQEDEEESEGGIFKEVDKDVDEIFDNLVSPEAQREVEKAETAKPAEIAPAPASVEAQVEEEEEQSSLFNKSLDSELDDIFSNLAPDEAQKKVTSETLAQVKAAEPKEGEGEISFEPPAEASSPDTTTSGDSAKSGKFVDTLGNLPAIDAAKTPVQMSAKDATVKESAAKSTETSEHPVLDEAAAAAAAETASGKSATPAKEIKEFGRLSARVSATAKPSETPGTMKTIGKLLIDVQAVENVIKHGETGQIGKNLGSARVLSAQRGEGIQNILNKIDAYPGIAGSLIVGHDGLVIASTLKGDMDRDTVGVLSVACLSTSNLGTRKLEIGKLKQMVMITNTTVNVFTDVDVGILAVFMNEVEIDKIDGLLETIQTTIHG